MRKIFSTIVGITLTMGSLGAAYAVNSYLGSFNSTYGTSGTALNSCTLCHPAGGGNNASNLNNFANDYANSGYSYSAIENLDSDGDGFTNIAEINARTFPGDAASHPAAGDTTLPVVTGFVVPGTSTSLTVPITALTASDNIGVIGYLVTETATVPAASASRWSGVKPQSYNFGSTGTKTLYVWAKDAAGNISAPISAVTTITINPLLYASFGTGSGIWHWEIGAWKQIDAALPTDMVASGSLMFASVPGSGVWQWNGGAWTRINSKVPTSMVASGTWLYANFTGYGLYAWDGAVWTKLNSRIPTAMVASGTWLYANFTGYGLCAWDGTAWTKLNSNNPTAMVASGGVVYANFTGYGLYKWDGSTWALLNSRIPTAMVAAGSVLYANFTGLGLHKWDGSAWTKLNSNIATSMVASGTLLYANFTGYGLYEWDGGTWTKLNSKIPASMVTSGVVLYADFESLGLWKWENNAWVRLSAINPAIMVTGF